MLGRITEDKYRALLDDAKNAGINMLRIWGGGIYESDKFYDLCDKYGIMVWQDFMYSTTYYPSHDREFYENIKHEAIEAIRRLRNRPSLIGWAGNNEVQVMYFSQKKWAKDDNFIFYGEDIYHELLPSLTTEYDPDRPYWPGCPFGGNPPDSMIEGDQHIWHYTHVSQSPEYLDLWMHTSNRIKFLSEFGILGPMAYETVEKCISPEARNINSEEWHFHSNKYKQALQDEIIEKYFGNCKRLSLKEYILKGQVIQAELMRHIYEELRSRKFECSGALMWSLSDALGTNGWALIDYYLNKKPAYYYFKRALAPLSITWNGYIPHRFAAMKNYCKYYRKNPQPLEIVAMNDTLEERMVNVQYSIITLDGATVEQGQTEPVTVPGNSTRVLLSVDLKNALKKASPEKLVVIAELFENAILIHENRYFLAPFKKLKLAPAEVKCKIAKKDGQLLELEFSSDKFVWMLHIASSDGAMIHDNDFDLIPGKARKILVSSENPDNYTPEFSSLNPKLTVLPV